MCVCGCVCLCVYRKGDLFQGIGLRNCGGWQVQTPQERLAGWRPREWLTLSFKPKGCLLAKCPLAGGGLSFILFRLSANWMRHTTLKDTPHMKESTLLRVHQFKCYSHPKNILTETPRKMFNHIPKSCDLAKLTHNINHHISFL